VQESLEKIREVAKTKIMYKAFLSYAQLKEYLSVLIANNLLEYLEGEQVYKTTDKGNRLKLYKQIGEYDAPDMEKWQIYT